MNAHEARLVRFVVPQYKTRFRESLESKRRDKLLASLPGFVYWDDRYLKRVPNAEQYPERIAQILIERGAPGTCYVVSINDDLDRTELPLMEALERTVGWEMGTLISCLPGRLAYFEGEPPNERYVLDRV